MSSLRSAAGMTVADVDAGKGLRVAFYYQDDTAPFPGYTGSYSARIDTGSITASPDGVFWAMRNNGDKMCQLRLLNFQVGWFGSLTPPTPALTNLRFERFYGSTPSGGTPMQVATRRPGSGASTVGDVRGGALLTTTGAGVDPYPFGEVSIPNQFTVGHGRIDLDGLGEESRAVIAPGEGLWVRAIGTPQAFTFLTGAVFWDERK